MPETPEAKETYTSRQFTVTEDEVSIVTEWVIFHTDNPVVGLSLLPGIGTQFQLDGQLIFSFVSSIDIRPTEGQSPVYMTATVSYGKPDSEKSDKVEPEADVATWSLSTAGQTINIQEAFGQDNFPEKAFPGTPGKLRVKGKRDNLWLTIGLTDNGVEGVDILSPQSTLKIVHWLPQGKTTPEFLDEITLLTGKTNDAIFKGPWGNWKIGEALYEGTEISAPNDELIELSHSFRRSLNSDGESVKIDFLDEKRVGQLTNFVEKKGWEYVWFQYGQKAGKIPDEDRPLDVSITAHIAEVYEAASFDALKLPKDFKSGSA